MGIGKERERERERDRQSDRQSKSTKERKKRACALGGEREGEGGRLTYFFHPLSHILFPDSVVPNL